MASNRKLQKPAMKTARGREAQKAGPGLPSSSPLPGNAGAGLPSGGAAPAPRRGSETVPGPRAGVGDAHLNVGRTGAHPMEVPGMPNGQGGNRNPNRVTSSGGLVHNSTPEPHNLNNDAEPTNPRYTPAIGPGSATTGPDATPGRPPSTPPLNVPDGMHPIGRVPNNPLGETTVPTERAPRPRMY